VSSYIFLKISIKVKNLSKNQNFIFKSNYDQNMKDQDDLYAHIVNVSLFFMQLRNNIDQSLTIQRHVRLRIIMKYNENDCFLVNLINNHLAITEWKHKRASWKKSINVTMLVITFALSELIKNTSTIKWTLFNEIIIFDNDFTFAQILNITTFYLKF